MEGNLYPWRTQKIVGHYTTYDDLLKPLPPPPDGLIWIKTRIDGGDKDGCSTRWELVERLQQKEADEAVEEKEEEDEGEEGLPDFIEHTVMETDTAGKREGIIMVGSPSPSSYPYTQQASPSALSSHSTHGSICYLSLSTYSWPEITLQGHDRGTAEI